MADRIMINIFKKKPNRYKIQWFYPSPFYEWKDFNEYVKFDKALDDLYKEIKSILTVDLWRIVDIKDNTVVYYAIKGTDSLPDNVDKITKV